jgi:hypothetical protein
VTYGAAAKGADLAGIIVLTEMNSRGASESLTIWCAVSGPPVGQPMKSPARILRVSLP